MIRQIYTAVILCGLMLSAGCATSTNMSNAKSNRPWVFVSMPDFPNFDIAYPQPQWEEAIDWYFKQVQAENPDFVLVAGDTVNGHWWDSKEQLEHLSAVYYGNWTRRMQHYGLTSYAAVGDHELGDDPWPAEKISLVPLFDKAFSQHMGMPTNGPAEMKGRVYYVLHNDTLIITVETFEVRDEQMHMSVTGEQLKWLTDVLEQNRNAKHIIVQGHVPIIPNVKARSSSGLMLEGATESDFWNVMKKYGVDMYLCGEFHDVTIRQQDGIWHIVHGASWGRVDTINYMVARVWPDKIELEIKAFPVILGGGNIWNINKPKGPRESVMIPNDVIKNGPQTIGTLTIDKSTGTKQFIKQSGVFEQ